jgi:hypothetical protein
MTKAVWTSSELETALRRFEHDLRAGGFEEPAVRTYVARSESFVRWLEGEWRPAVGDRPATDAVGSGGLGHRLVTVLSYVAIVVFGLMWLALPFLVLLILVILA